VLKAKLAAIFATKTRDEWAAIFDATDACVAPILSMNEAVTHPHNVARGTFAEIGGAVQPIPAPRYSVTQNAVPDAAPAAGADTEAVLAALGYDGAQIAAVMAS
jgi:alpha-methylacyl-CoA racemase